METGTARRSGLRDQIVAVITAGHSMKDINGILGADWISIHIIKGGLPLHTDIIIPEIISLLGLELVIIQPQSGPIIVPILILESIA